MKKSDVGTETNNFKDNLDHLPNQDESEIADKDTTAQPHRLIATLTNPAEFFSNGHIARAVISSGQRDLLLLSDKDGNPEYFFGVFDRFSNVLLQNQGMDFKREPYSSFDLEPLEIKNATQAQEQLLRIIPKFKIFEGLSHLDVLKITKNVQFKRFNQGEIIFNKGDISKEVFILITGCINLYNDNTLTTHQNADLIRSVDSSGTIIGELGPFTNEIRSAKGVAMGNDTVLVSFEINEEKVGWDKALNQLHKNVIVAISEKLRDMNKVV